LINPQNRNLAEFNTCFFSSFDRLSHRVSHINFNLYHYAGNNPVRYLDPDGRMDCGAVKNKVLESNYEEFSETGYQGFYCFQNTMRYTEMGSIDSNIIYQLTTIKFDNSPDGQQSADDLSNDIDSQRELALNLTLFIGGTIISFTGVGVLAKAGSTISKICGGICGASIGTGLGLIGLFDKYEEIEIDAGDTVTIQKNTLQQYDGSQPVGSPTNTFILRVYDKESNLKYEENMEY